MTQKRIVLPHSGIVKAPGLPPRVSKVCQLAIELTLPERTLRDWLEAGVAHQRAERARIRGYGPDFSNWRVGQRTPKKEEQLAPGQVGCFRCRPSVEMLEASPRPIKRKLIMPKGTCPQCGCRLNRAGRISDHPASPVSVSASLKNLLTEALNAE